MASLDISNVFGVDSKAAGRPLPKAPLVFGAAERAAASRIVKDFTDDPDGLLDDVLGAINEVRTGNPIGTLRQEPGARKFALRWAEGKWAVLDTEANPGAFRSFTDDAAPEIQSWILRYRP